MVHVDAVVAPFDGNEGGDWYDVLELDDEMVAISVVDTAGYGPAAARLAGGLRATRWRERLRRGEPAAALRGLSRRVADQPEGFATAICAVWWPCRRRLRLSNAGHIPPILVKLQGAVVLDRKPDPPLGLVGPRSASHYDVGQDAALVFCTDGLIERRRGSLDDGIAVLRKVLSGRPPNETSAMLLYDEVVNELGPVEDDVTVVVVRTDEASAGRALAPSGAGPNLARYHGRARGPGQPLDPNGKLAG